MANAIIEQPLLWDGTPFATPCDGERNVESRPAVLPMGQTATLRLTFLDRATFAPVTPDGSEDASTWRFELRDKPGVDFTVLFATSAVTPAEKHIDIAAANTLTEELEAALGERASGVFPAMLSGFDANNNRVFTACFPLCVANTTESEAVPVGADSLSKQVKALDGRVTELEEHQQDVDDVLFFDTKENPVAGQTAFPLYGEDGKIYGAKDTGRLYRWDADGEDYVQVGGGDAPVTSVNGKTGAVVLSASDVGAASDTALANHVGDSVKHVTAAERAVWNGKMPGSATGENIPIDDSHLSISYALTSVAERFSAYRTASAQDAIDSAQNTAIAAKYAKPSGGIPASDLASGVIPSVPVKAVKRNGTALVPDANGAVNVDVPTGTAASKDVPVSGDATAQQVVMGGDSRLSDARTPKSHRHKLEYSYSDGVYTEQPEGTIFKANNKGDIVPAVAGYDYVDPSSLSPVAHSGDYDDLRNKPTIPTVPTNVSAFTNDAGYLTSHQSLANYVQKSQTAGLLKNDGTVDTNTYLTTAPVTSVNGQTGAVTLAIPDISGKLDATKRNLLDYTSSTTLALGTAVYQSSLASDGTFPTVDATGIPPAAAYYQFELELAVPSAIPSTITGPSGWVWLDGHGLPDPADLSGGETIYVSVRLDCTARTFLASVWRVA